MYFTFTNIPIVHLALLTTNARLFTNMHEKQKTMLFVDEDLEVKNYEWNTTSEQEEAREQDTVARIYEV